MPLTYVNPVELLNLAGVPVSSIEAATVKKRRKELLADLELGDGVKDYKGQRLDRSACERACAELDEPEHLRVWHRLANMPALNDFLGSGRPDFLLAPASASSLAADTHLLRLVGPRYAVQYDQALLAAFRARDVARVQQVAAAPALYLPAESRLAHQSVSRLLREQLSEIEQQTESFDEDGDAEQVLANLKQTLNAAGWTAALNALPTGAFGILRIELVMAVRHFAIQFHNTFSEQTPALKLLQEAATLQLDGQSADRVREDIRQIREIETERTAEKERDEWIGQYNEVIHQLIAYRESLSAPDTRAFRIWLKKLDVLISNLNRLSGKEVLEARTDLAWSVRGLAVGMWNRNQANGDTSLMLFETGLKIQAEGEVNQLLKDDRKMIKKLRTKRMLNQVPDGVWSWGGIALIVFIVTMCNKLTDSPVKSEDNIHQSSQNIPSPSAPTPAGNDNDKGHYVYDATTGNPTLISDSEASKYAGNQLTNGASPLDNCFGKGRYAGPAWVNFKNDNNDTDAIVCLARTSNNKVIRNEYIRAGTSFRMSHIPAGSYYLKVFYGHDWNPTRKSACGTKGYFDTDQRFSESRAADDLVNIEVSSRSYTTGTMTLYSVAGGNMAQESIDATEFFRQ